MKIYETIIYRPILYKSQLNQNKEIKRLRMVDEETKIKDLILKRVEYRIH